MREYKLPSGAVLKVNPAPFSEAKQLYQAILAELKEVKMSAESDMTQLFKDIVCVGFSSQNVEVVLQKCLARCLYNDMKIENETFEKLENRKDYIPVCVEVLRENIEPFLNGLYVAFQTFLRAVNTKDRA